MRAVPTEAGRGFTQDGYHYTNWNLFYRQFQAALGLLGNKPESSARETSVVKCYIISPTTGIDILNPTPSRSSVDIRGRCHERRQKVDQLWPRPLRPQVITVSLYPRICPRGPPPHSLSICLWLLEKSDNFCTLTSSPHQSTALSLLDVDIIDITPSIAHLIPNH